MTPKDNERLTRVTGDAPMARLLRENYWLPFTRSEALVAGEGPQRVRLLGHDLVAYRADDGSVGLMDEYCPHRRASMMLARVEGCTLRCIYHGWRLDETGKVVEVPSEGDRSDLFSSRVKTNRRIAREGGGLVWAFLGQGDPPPLPPLPFMNIPADRRFWVRMTGKYNWLQDLEGTQDSSHLSWLHTAFHGEGGDLESRSLTYEIAETSYGLRTAAMRETEDSDKVQARVAEFVAPFYTLSPARQPVLPNDCAAFAIVPVDDETHLMFFCFWDDVGKLGDLSNLMLPDTDFNEIVNERDYHRGNNWGQDRAAMRDGHFSGIKASLVHEDAAVQASMGTIVDRSEETLCSSDLAVVRMRSTLLDLLKRQDEGQPIDGAMDGYRRDGHVPFSRVVAKGTDWREMGQRNSPPDDPAIPMNRNCEPLAENSEEKVVSAPS